MMARLDTDAINRNANLPGLIAGVVPLKPDCNGGFKACCPVHSERTPSFTVFEGRDGIWRFQCFGCGAQGDALDFIRLLHGVGLREAAAMLAGGDLPTIEVAPVLQHEQGDRLGQVREIWRSARPAPGTVAETYLRWRGLDLAIPESIRFAELRYGQKGRKYPCLVACIAGPDNRLCGIQRTYLADDGLGKANVPKAKLSLGKVRGGAIRLAPAAGEMVVCEGLEDGLTLQQEMGRAVWVSAGTAMLPAMQFPSITKAITIGGDGDQPGRAAVAKARTAFEARGLQVRTFFPPSPFKDFNDELRGARP